jgi:predicted HTH transcriptional regulator
MNQLLTLDDISLLSESVELECKLAVGRDGKGELPIDFWKTYSAMANTRGGKVLLGIKERKGEFSVVGVEDVEKVRKDLFSTLNNRSKVSANLLTDDDVTEYVVDDKIILEINVPAAPRKTKPVFLNNLPLTETWHRLNEGDCRCDESTVKRMFAEQTEDERDARILEHFGIDDIDLESLQIYRQMLRAEKPAHPFLEADDFNFLCNLRGWRRDRETKKEGLTLAGLLMFGKWQSIQEAQPAYFVDYQERPEARAEQRWVDRIIPDGTWTGNLFDFYRRVYRKLVTDLKIPFAIKDGQRQEDTPAHIAIREALVNTLVHADFSVQVSILVVKRPDMFGFRNPGHLRLPLEQVLKGGESDCRNRILHQMFLMVGLGERAGSGIQKIYSGWTGLHWRKPLLYEKDEPEQTLLELRMMDLLPEPIIIELRQRFGSMFDALTRTERLILATAAIEQVVNHTRLAEICGQHPHDLSLSLAKLVRDGLLKDTGQSRGKTYHLVGEKMPTPEQVFPLGIFSSVHSDVSSIHSTSSYVHNEFSSVHKPDQENMPLNSRRDEKGCLLSSLLETPIIDNLDLLSTDIRSHLELVTAESRSKKRLEPDAMKNIILQACKDFYLTLSVLSKLLDRNVHSLRRTNLNELVKSHQIQLAFPSKPTHESQAYRTVKLENKEK